MKLIKDVDFIPVDRLVITFDKLRTFPSKYTILDKEANKGKDPLKDEMETKVVTKKVNYNIQEARVLAVPSNEGGYSVGDIVIVDMRVCIALDGYKDIYTVTKYNIIGVKAESLEGTLEEGDEFTGDDGVNYKYAGNNTAEVIN